MKPSRNFNEWMHQLKHLQDVARDPNQDLIMLIIVILLELFVFLIEWRFKQRAEDYKED